MSYYDDIYEYAADNYGLITSAIANELGIPRLELVKLERRGRLQRIGQGVYRVKHYIPTGLDKYAEAVAIVGKGAYIYGESVLAMCGLALVNPAIITVATTARVRKKLATGIKIVARKDGDQIKHFEGIPAQSMFEAVLACKGIVMSERLEEAVNEAYRLGYIDKEEAIFARKELKHGSQDT